MASISCSFILEIWSVLLKTQDSQHPACQISFTHGSSRGFCGLLVDSFKIQIWRHTTAHLSDASETPQRGKQRISELESGKMMLQLNGTYPFCGMGSLTWSCQFVVLHMPEMDTNWCQSIKPQVCKACDWPNAWIQFIGSKTHLCKVELSKFECFLIATVIGTPASFIAEADCKAGPRHHISRNIQDCTS